MKISALIVIVLLLAMPFAAAEIETFPTPFLKDGKFDGAIIVGENGQGKDFVATSELVNGLQKYTAQAVVTPVTSTPALKTSFQLKGQHDNLESAEFVNSIASRITGAHLSALAPGTVKNDKGTFDYQQNLMLPPSSVTPNYGMFTKFDIAMDIPMDDDEIPKGYLEFVPGSYLYEYRLNFYPSLESDVDAENDYELEDIKGMTLSILGKNYVVLKADHPAQDSIQLTLLTATQKVTIREGETKTVTLDGKDYEITALFISNSNSDSPEAKLMINGEDLKAIGESETKRFHDVTVYAHAVLVNSRDALVEISIGDGEIILTDTNITDATYGSPYEVGSETITDTAVKIEGFDDGLVAGGQTKIKSIYIKWTPTNTYFIGSGKKLSEIVQNPDALFGRSIDIAYSGTNVNNNIEGIEMRPLGSDRYELVFFNKLGQELKIPIFYDNAGSFTRLGDEDRTLHILENVSIAVKDYFLFSSVSAAQAVNNGKGYTRLMQYYKQDASENKLWLKDMPSGKEYEVDYTDGASSTNFIIDGYEYLISLNDSADNGAIKFDLDNNGTIWTGAKPVLVTKYESRIDIETSGTYAFKRFTFYSHKKSGSIIGTTMSAALYSSVGPAVQAALNASLGANITSNPVLTSSGITSYYDSVRVTIEDDGGDIDIANVERCVDGASKDNILAVTTTAYDSAVYAMTNKTVGQYVYDTFLDNVCYLTWTTTKKFMYTVGDTDEKQGTTTFTQLVTWSDVTGGSDKFSIMSPQNQVEQMVYLQSGVQAPAAPTQTATVVSRGTLQTVLDSDAEATTLSGIVLGGPCANSIAANLLGEECGKLNLMPGEARVTLVKKDAKTWLVISGYTDDDTLFATKLLLAKPSVLIGGSDLVVSGSLETPSVRTYTPLENVPSPAAPAPLAPAPVEPVAEVKADCEAPSEATGTYQYQLKKLGITKDMTSYPKVSMDGLKGTVTYTTSEKFQAQLGVDWLQYVVHVHKGDCSGPEVAALTFKWVDGDGDKSESFTVPEPGCYCLKVASEDLSVDDASIKMAGEGIFTLPFGTETPVGGNLLTGNAFFFALSKEAENDMNLWD